MTERSCGSKMEGPRPDKFAFVERSRTMKAPVGLLSDRTVLRSKMEGLCPDKFAFVEQSGTIKEQCFRWVDPLESTALSL